MMPLVTIYRAIRNVLDRKALSNPSKYKIVFIGSFIRRIC